MKKKIILVLIAAIIIMPTIMPKATTIKELESELSKYKAEQKKNQTELNQTQGQINSSNKEIENIKTEIKNMTAQIQQMHLDSIEYGNQIKDKEIETKEIFDYYQLSQSGNLYLEYAFGAETITDLVYRLSLVEQIIDDNNNKVDELNKMIKDNAAREIELNKKEIEMGERQKELTSKVSKLTGVKASLNENSVSVAKQIQIYEDIIKGYKNLGCKANDVIGVDCAKSNNAGEWVRPTTSGYVTSEFGSRWGSLHRAVDVSNKNPYNTKIYPVANGRISAKYEDYYGALTIVIEHRTMSGKYYSSLYTHMSKYAPNVYVGKNVTINDYIGYMGDTGYSFGPHLHLEIAPCRLYNQSDSNCKTWDKYVSYVKSIYNNGSFKGPRDLIYFPKTNVPFNGRR